MEQKQINLSALRQSFEKLAEKNWALSAEVFAPEFCASLAQECQKLYSDGFLKKASMGPSGNKLISAEIRGDFTLWLDEGNSETQKQFLQSLNVIREELNQFFFMGLKRVESHFAFYPPEAGYDKHIDNPRGASHRKITFVLYLNEAWQKEHGGELSLYNPENPEEMIARVEPRLGQLIFFRSDLFPHQVEKSFNPGLSLTGWFRDDAL
ncbi:2OG-Fe(II) oxygenase [Bdellovibrio sp. SKB1291214]|uniref:2OG-Fe(II) oxygenase n=1 Tax=Bdellovibrio sp. SKB1291214 TaxID=1732569 RepID=UPI0022403698|nr:2OG-Fe(II) oxygenase [Bdellovibrio sp. SKB1291214]UYL07559.1 2OG-Fe(II) oxygenase [Bdellovibrio sp. SKB1291214]